MPEDPAHEPADDPADAAALAAHAADLADGVERALPGWVERSVARVLIAYRGSVTAAEQAAAAEAGIEAARTVGPRLRRLLEADIDDQATAPLTIVRGAVVFPTAVLRDAGVPPVVRDEFAERQLPDDVYDLAPASFAEVDPALHEPGLTWGAAKAHVHLARRRPRPGG